MQELLSQALKIFECFLIFLGNVRFCLTNRVSGDCRETPLFLSRVLLHALSAGISKQRDQKHCFFPRVRELTSYPAQVRGEHSVSVVPESAFFTVLAV